MQLNTFEILLFCAMGSFIGNICYGLFTAWLNMRFK